MQQSQRRIILAIDMDYFYAQCEELRNPSAVGKPVVVGMFSGRTEVSGAVATSNYEARKYGVKSGIPIAAAKRLLEGVDAVLVPPDFPYYESVSDSIMTIIRSYSDKFSKESIDEAFIDVTERSGSDYAAAEKLSMEIKERIRRETGIRCSVGVGRNKLISKMACDASKPDGLMVVKEEGLEDFLREKPVDRLFGVGPKTAERLGAMGVKTVGELAGLPLHALQKEFGNKLGLYFFLSAKGVDDTPLEEREREQIGRMLTLKEDTRDVDAMGKELLGMARDISSELGAQSLSYRSVTVVVVDTAIKHHTRSRTLRAKETDAKVAAAVGRDLLEEFFDKEPRTVARRLGLTVSGLSREAGQSSITAFFS
ncbi:MAG: DNA polymerase IV [Nitrososphaerota archaeon]|nr:DNA polymerase IV [Nitrososphaerota archaeon]